MKKLGFVLMAAVLFSACGGGGSVNSRLNRVESVVCEYPDSALKMIRSIDRRTIVQDKMLARYALLYSQALDKACIDVTQDSLALLAAEYYRDNGPGYERAKSLYYLGRVYENAGEELRAVEAFVQAEVFSLKFAQDDPYLQGLINLSLGRRYHFQGGLEEAARCYKKSIGFFTLADSDINIGRGWRDLGFVYYDMEDFPASRDALRKAVNYFEISGMPRMEFSELPVWVEVLETATDSTRTIQQKINWLRVRERDGSAQHSVCESFWLAHYYGLGTRQDSCRYYVQQALDRNQSVENRLWAYDALSGVEALLGNHKKAFMYRKMHMNLDDSVRQVRQFPYVRIMDFKLDALASQQSFEALEARNFYQTIIGVLSLVLVVVLGWLLVHTIRLWRQRLHAQHEADVRIREESEAKWTQMYNDLQERYNELVEQMKILSTDKREAIFFKAVETRLMGLRNLVNRACNYKVRPQAFYDDFVGQVSVNPNSKKEMWADLQYVVNRKSGIVDYLHENFVDLNMHDVDFCCLLCFGFLPSGISFMYGYDGMGSLYNKRSRLRQKLQVPEGDKLEEYVLNLHRDLQQKMKEKEGQSDSATRVTTA